MRHLNRSRQYRAKRFSQTTALLETLEPRILLSSAPIGSVDNITRNIIQGWAFNADDGAAAVTINITINGATSTVLANTNISLLTPYFGSPYHGFVYTMPTLPPGNSTVTVQAVSPTSGATTLLRTVTLTNPPPVGSVVVTSTDVSGWAYDPDSTSPIQIRVDVDGVAGTPVTTNVARSDVASVSHFLDTGFDVAGSYSGKVVEVYAIDTPSGRATLLYSNNRTPIGQVTVNDGHTIQGWAYDFDDPDGAAKIFVMIDGVALSGTPTPANAHSDALQTLLHSPNHAFGIIVPGLTPGKHTIVVVALDSQAKSAPPVLLSVATVNNNPPTGHVDFVNNAVVYGWAYDPDLGTAPTTVSVYVDDFLYQTVTANVNRPDLKLPVGTQHGFVVYFTGLGNASHSITVTAHDDRASDQNEVVIYDDFINNHQPVGAFTAIRNGLLLGWAQDPDAPTTSIAVDIYVDGTYSTTGSANLNHGFAIDMPAMSFGTHTIEIYASESQGNVSTLIGTQTYTNIRPVGGVDIATTSFVAGWAADPDRMDTSVDIDVYINGTLAVSGRADVTRNDLIPFLGAAHFGYNIALPTLASGRNQIDVYAVDPTNNLLSILGSRVITV